VHGVSTVNVADKKTASVYDNEVVAATEAAYAATVGPILAFLQSRVDSVEVVDVAELLLSLLPLPAGMCVS
jgi:hypothetical protein